MTTTDFTAATEAEFHARIGPIEKAAPEPESFDATAACQRVLYLADAVERGDVGAVTPRMVAALMRVAVYDSAAVLLTSKEG